MVALCKRVELRRRYSCTKQRCHINTIALSHNGDVSDIFVYMAIENVIEQIIEKQPDLIYISGKTSTGKSTLANQLKESLKCAVIELDAIVQEEVDRNPSIEEGVIFREIYRERSHTEWIHRFVDSARSRVKKLRLQGTVSIMEGAVAHPQTIKEIVSGTNSLIVYIQPVNLDVYIRNLTSRFMSATNSSKAGLPLSFWDKMPKDALNQFIADRKLSPRLQSAIELYATESQHESQERLDLFKKNFDDVIVITI